MLRVALQIARAAVLETLGLVLILILAGYLTLPLLASPAEERTGRLPERIATRFQAGPADACCPTERL